jgi:16S rRNA (cytosine1402-N4)-methyltransferase
LLPEVAVDVVEHFPVLADEVVESLVRGPGWYFDATVGGGGHAARLLGALPAEARLLGFDRDPDALARAADRLRQYGDRVRLVHASFDQLGEVMRSERLGSLAGALFDLGLSSLQLGDASRGFSFAHDAPLDLRFDPTTGEPAWRKLATADEATLASWFFAYGELREGRRLAKAIVQYRGRKPIERTSQLRDAVGAVWGDRPHPRRLAQLFQALRIAVNEELDRVERGLHQAAEALEPEGRLAVITYHSLEDRLTKRFLQGSLPPKREAQLGAIPLGLLSPVTRRAIVPTPAEVARNPRAGSARLRVARRIAA